MKIKLTQSNVLLSAFSYSSLTDIVLLLLIFFLLTSSFIVVKGLKVNLPAATNIKASDQHNIVVDLLKDGSMYVNGKQTAATNLRRELQAVFTDPEKQVVVLSSDREVPLAQAVFVMDEAKGIGASRFFISTVKKDAPNDSKPR